MTRLRVTSAAVLALATLAAPAARAQQSPKPAPKAVCYPIRYKTLRDMPDESRTYEQQKEFERLQKACADAAVDNAAPTQAAASSRPAQQSRASAQQPQKAAPGAASAPAQRPAAPETRAAGAVERAPAPRAPTAGKAAEEPLRHGFWFSGGLGWGSLGCSDCGTRENGGSGSISLGGTLSQHVQLGAGVDVWVKDQNGVNMSAGTVTALVRFYPMARGGFFLVGGVGGSSFTVSGASGGFGFTASTNGAGAILGLGYDVRVGRKVSVTPYLNGVAMKFDGGDMNFSQLGLAVTLH